MSGPTSAATRFMESRLSLLRMHWDQQPERAQRRAGVPPAQRAFQRERFHSVGVAGRGRRDACPTLTFLESREFVILCNRALLRFPFVNRQDVVGPFRGLEFRRARSAVDRVAGLERVGGYFVNRGQLSAGRGGDI